MDGSFNILGITSKIDQSNEFGGTFNQLLEIVLRIVDQLNEIMSNVELSV